jgi:hypothetical protein
MDDDDVVIESLEVSLPVNGVVATDPPPSITAKWAAMVLHILNNTSSITPTMGSVVVKHIPMGIHNLFFLPILSL